MALLASPEPISKVAEFWPLESLTLLAVAPPLAVQTRLVV